MKNRILPLFILFTAIALLNGAVFADESIKTKHKPGKGFTIESENGDFSLTIGGYIQARHTFESLDDDKVKADESITEGTISNFTVHRIRFSFQGKFFQEWKYKLETEFGRNKSTLKDGQIIWAPMKQANLSFGQFKVFFDRQAKISDKKQTFVDRSLATGEFGISRDVGVQFYGATESDLFQYNIGIYNGEGEGSNNPNNGHLVVGHISLNPNGNFGLSESDIHKTDKHLWFVDLSTAFYDKSIIDEVKTDDIRYVASFGYRHAGFYWQNEYFMRELDPEGLADVESDGWYTQLGYMIQHEVWEIAGRYSMVDPNEDFDDDTESEIMIGLNRFFRKAGHTFKFTADLARLTEEVGPGIEYQDIRSRLQLQVIY